MFWSSLIISAVTLAFSPFLYQKAILLAHQFGILDHPSPRRRHRTPTPIVGGLCIFFNWTVCIVFLAFTHASWFKENKSAIFAMGASLLILIAVGLVDDVRGLTPKPKLLLQALAAVIVLKFEPSLHSLGLYWQNSIGVLIWPLMAMWIMGITNAINLIDGLDGLAGGTAFLVSASIAALACLSGYSDSLQCVLMVMLAGSILGFLKFNWHPAKLFLGDNGSLPLGFLISVSSLTCHPPTRSWVMIASILMMLGYPMLDMGLAVLRRYRSNLPLFKADRNHLHFRLQRLGPSVSQTAIFLLSISLYLQISAVCLNLLPPSVVIPSMALVLFSIAGMLYMVKCIETSRLRRLAAGRDVDIEMIAPRRRAGEPPTHPQMISVSVSLSPIFEVGLHEEKERCLELISALEGVLRATALKDEAITCSRNQIQILFPVSENILVDKAVIRKKYEAKLEKFCALADLQCSLSTIPINVKRVA